MTLEEAGFCTDREQELYDYLESTNTDAFLLLKDGKIVIERYFGDFTVFTPHLWNSAGKSLTAFLVGMAADLDSLNINDPTSQYLGAGWTNCPDTEADIKIIHQLSMTTSLDDGVENSACYDPECLVCKAAPGTRWSYHNGPYTLLTDVIESATNQGINTFIAERLTPQTGITGQYRDFGFNEVFISTARSMARFGILVQGNGRWGGTPILQDTAYLRDMITPSQSLNPSYGYLWWLNGQPSYLIPTLQIRFPGPLLPNAPMDLVAAIGKDAQLLNIVPSQGLIMVRMGSTPEDGSLVSIGYNDAIWEKINGLYCTTATSSAANLPAGVSIFPNPAGDFITLRSAAPLRRVSVFDQAGRVLRSERLSGQVARLSLEGLPRGVLLLRIADAQGGVSWRRVVHR